MYRQNSIGLYSHSFRRARVGRSNRLLTVEVLRLLFNFSVGWSFRETLHTIHLPDSTVDRYLGETQVVSMPKLDGLHHRYGLVAGTVANVSRRRCG
jgi:hypothetical protein